MRALIGICLGMWLAAVTAQLQAQESVETDISSRKIAIESNFTGASIVVFGSISNSRQDRPDAGLYDLAVVVRGPEKPVVVRRKSRILGIWINDVSRPYQNIPGFYAVLSTRPLNEIADKDVLNKYGIGFPSLVLERTEAGEVSDPFRDAVIRIRANEGLFLRDEKGVKFIGKSLFRATVDLPATVPVGEYWADVFVFSNGKLLSNNSTTLQIDKQGFERLVYEMAFTQPLLYGLVAVAAAIIAGLLASAVFRKD